uniref:Uncharacterized protein n=1 Tax=Arundo donax TaxID=35708 RepID=A0A0A9CYJ2_ARUDO
MKRACFRNGKSAVRLSCQVQDRLCCIWESYLLVSASTALCYLKC